MIAAVVLAAGAASRMGWPKQLLPLAGRPLVRHAVDAACAAGVDEILVVTGACADEVAAAVAGLPVRVIHNADWPSGQAASLKAGLAAVSPAAEAVIFLLADQPLVTAELVGSLIAAYRRGGGTIVVPVAAGRRGNPVLFDLGRWRQELATVAGDAGARGLIDANPLEAVTVEVAAESFLDIDTPADYAHILAMRENRRRPGGDNPCE